MPESGGIKRQGTTAPGQSASCRRCAGSRHWKGGTRGNPGIRCGCCCWSSSGSRSLRSSCRWWLWWRRCCCCCFIFRRRELAAMTLVASVLVLSLYSLGVSWCLVLPQPWPGQGGADTPGRWASSPHLDDAASASVSAAPPPPPRPLAGGRAPFKVAASPGFVHARKLHFEVQHPNLGVPVAGDALRDVSNSVQKHQRTLQFSSNSKDGATDSAGKHADNTKSHVTHNVKGSISSMSSSSTSGSSRNKPMHQRKISETASAVYLEVDDDDDDDSEENDDDDGWGLPPAGEEYREGPREGPQAGGNTTWKRRLPAAIIIGVKKAGTRALLEFLRIHPNVQAPGPEPHFFDRNYNRGLDWYRQLMPFTREGQLTIEKTPSYFITREVPKRVQSMSKDLKLLVVVRDPVTRAISDYAQAASKRGGVGGSRMRSFEDMALLDHRLGIVNTSWGAIRIGVYTKHLERWFKYFPRQQFHFVSGEQLIADPAGVLKQVQDFLGLPQFVGERHFYLNATRGFPCLVKSPETHSKPHCLGKTKGRRHPQVDPRVLDRLRAFYRPFNAKLYQMVGRDFGWS